LSFLPVTVGAAAPAGPIASLHSCRLGARRLRHIGVTILAQGSRTEPYGKTQVSRKLWLGGALAVVLAGCLCLVAPRLGALALIVLALAAVAAFAFRFL